MMSTLSSERDFQEEATPRSRKGGFVEWSKTPFAMFLGATLLLLVVAAFFLGVIQDHQSALEICSENGGSYEAAYKVCTMPGEELPK